MAAGSSSLTRAVFMGAYGPGDHNRIDYKDYSTSGDASDFGNLTVGRGYGAAASTLTRCVMMGGYSPVTNIIDKVEMDTTGDAADLGDLNGNNYTHSGCAGAPS